MPCQPCHGPTTRPLGKARNTETAVPTRTSVHRGAAGNYDRCEAAHTSDACCDECSCCFEPAPRCQVSTVHRPRCSANANLDLYGAPTARAQGLRVVATAPRPPVQPNAPVPVMVDAVPVELTGSGTVFCVVFVLAIIFVAVMVVQVYLMHMTSYHDPLLAAIEEHDKQDAAHGGQGQHEQAASTTPAILWKVKPGSRPADVVSRRPYAHWKSKGESALAVEKKLAAERQTPPPPPPPPVLRDYPLLLPRDYKGERKSICMYHAVDAGRTRNGAHYKPWNFPYHLCTHVVYCCAGISGELDVISRHFDIDITEGSIASFAAMKLKNPYLRVYIGIGSDDKDRAGLARVVASVDMRQKFAQNAVAWMRRAQYDGMVLYWRYPFLEQKSRLVDTMRYLRQGLRSLYLTCRHRCTLG
ncbi:hypothetical protein HPB48_019701 [Haemaphysalis longicornis]|uniref:GH18 domain-containing protein n=1 Tax=Haemaphysalis longicornis TaxID=44386 RepID=A0A9J6G4X7_HAELO|nr:hypothetical protein HPB48_019701 [Haemaphysalis longicornis]